jgi:hypothetical protein
VTKGCVHDAVLDERDLLERELYAKVASSGHDGICCAAEFVEVVEHLRSFDLGDDASLVVDEVTERDDVCRVLYEGEC